ncbi:MAG TPA: DUF6194 family protein [Candidatus Limnocylindrales bacterium]|jgi:hypothetical protein|nr:DUF6194 family protein [Actinomycetota bacterium]
MGATLFSLNDQGWPNFATIVTTDEHDMGTPSNLVREGALRLNIGVGKATFERLVGSITDPDFAALDTVLGSPGKGRGATIAHPSGADPRR